MSLSDLKTGKPASLGNRQGPLEGGTSQPGPEGGKPSRSRCFSSPLKRKSHQGEDSSLIMHLTPPSSRIQVTGARTVKTVKVQESRETPFPCFGPGRGRQAHFHCSGQGTSAQKGGTLQFPAGVQNALLTASQTLAASLLRSAPPRVGLS